MKTKNKRPVKKVTPPRFVDEVYMHIHLDEVFAYFLALFFGKTEFVGIEKAKIFFRTDVPNLTEVQWRKRKALSIGAGKDIDEHTSGLKARKKNSSASQIMSEKIPNLFRKYRVLRKFLTEVTWFDSHDGCPASHLATILKRAKVLMLRDVAPDERSEMESGILNWSVGILECVYHERAFKFPQTQDELPFLEFVEQCMAGDPEFFDEEGKRALMKVLTNTKSSLDKPLFLGLEQIYQAVWRVASWNEKEGNEGFGKEDASNQILFALKLLYKDQMDFLTFRREIIEGKHSKSTSSYAVQVGDQRGFVCDIKAVVSVTDCPKAHAVFRSLGAVVSVVRHPKRGNVTILGDSHYSKDPKINKLLYTGFQNLSGMLRFLEMPKELREKLKKVWKDKLWDHLCSRGSCVDDRYWHLNDWLSLLNGSDFHDRVPKTTLTDERVKNCLLQAFNPKSLELWKKDMKITEEEKPRAKKSDVKKRPVQKRGLFAKSSTRHLDGLRDVLGGNK